MDPNQQPMQSPEDSLNAVSAEVVSNQVATKSKPSRSLKRWDIILPIVALVALIIFGAIIWRVWSTQKNNQEKADGKSQSVNLNDVSTTSSSFQVSDSNKVVINGLLSASQGLILQPTDVPATPKLGQIYIDASGVMRYFNGEEFVVVGANQGGNTTNINNITNVTNIANVGVNSLQGLDGSLTLSGSNGLTVTSGATNLQINLPQNLTAAASPSFTGLALSGNADINGDATIGGNGIINGGSLILDNSSGSVIQSATGQDLTISAGGNVLTLSSGGRTFILPTTGPSSQTICTTGISCASGGGQGVLLAPGSAQTNASNDPADSSIFINNTGTAALLQLQGDGSDVFTVASDGDTFIGGTLSVNSITPTAALTVGSSGQSLTLQGNASSTISVTGGGFTTNVGFTGSPVGNVTYNFDRTVAAGTYSVCSTAGTAACLAVYAASSGSGNYIQNQNSSDQTANFRISGTGQANTSILTPLVDTATTTTLRLGTTTANNVIIGSTSAGSTVVQSASGLYVGNGVSSASPAAGLIQGTGSSTSGTAGAGLTVQGGAGNGSGKGGNLTLQGGTAGASSAGSDVSILGGSAGGGNTNGGNIVLSGGAKSGSGSSGMVIVRPQSGNDSAAAFQIQNTSTDPIFSVGTVPPNNMVSNGNFETNVTGWSTKGSSSLSRSTAHAYFGTASLQIVTGAAANAGASTAISFTNSTSYSLSLYARANADFSTFRIGHVDSGSDVDCGGGFFQPSVDQSVSSSGWKLFTCTFTASNTTAIYVKQSDATARTIYIDNVAVQASSTGTHSAAAGTINLNAEINSPLLVQPSEDSNTALHIMSSNGFNVLNVDTLNQQVAASSSITTAFQATSTASYGLQGVTVNASSYGVYGSGFLLGGGVLGQGATLASGMFQNGAASNTSATLVTKLVNSQTSDLFQAQNSSGSALFSINTSGDVVFSTDSSPGTAHSISVAAQTNTDTAGKDLSIVAGAGNGTGSGGKLTLQGGAAGNGISTVNGGGVDINGANGQFTGSGGTINLTAGRAGAGINGGKVQVLGGAVGQAGGVAITGGSSDVNFPGSVTITGGASANAGNMSGGSVVLNGGAPTGTGSYGNIFMQNVLGLDLGNVGIGGLSSVTARLHIASNTASLDLLKVTDSTSSSVDVLTIADEGAATFKNRTNSTNAFQVQNSSSSTIFKVDTTNNLVALQGSGGVSISTLGTADNSTYLCRNSSGLVATCQSGGTSSAFIQGGNSFGATGTLGTNDSNSLAFETNNVTRLTLDTSGNITIAAATSGGPVTHTLSVGQAASNTAGDNLTIAAGQGNGTTRDGGTLTLQGGAPGAAGNGAGGSVSISGTNGTGLGSGGQVNISAGSIGTNVVGATINLSAPNVAASSNISLTAGTTTAGFAGGAISINGGSNTQSSGTFAGGAITIQGGNASGTGSTGNGGAVSIQGGTTVGGSVGNISVGTNTGSNTIQIGTASANSGKTQTINIGNLNAAGTTNITIGTGSSATAGTTTIQAKGALTLTGGAASTWDIGANTLSIQSTNNGDILLGSGTFTVGGNTSIANNKSLTANGSALFKDATNSTTAFQIQNSAGNEVLTADTSGNRIILGKASTLDGQLVLKSTSGSGSITLLPSNVGSVNFSINLPSENGVVCLQYSADCGFALGSNAFLQDGNTFGGNATIGTDDSFSLNFETDGTTQATIDVGGATTFHNSTNSTSGFVVQDSSNDPVFNVDTTNKRIGIGTATPSFDLSFGYVGSLTNHYISTEDANITNGAGDNIILQGGGGSGIGDGGKVAILGGQGGSGTGGNGGDVVLLGGTSASTNANGGNLILSGGLAGGSGTNGGVLVHPQADSATAFQVADASSNVLFGIDTTGNGAISIQARTSGTISIGTVNNLAVTIGTAGGTLTVASPATFTSTLTVNNNLTIGRHVLSTNASGTTTIAAGAAACTSPTVSLSGSDTAGTVTITTGTGCSAGGLLATISFASAYGAGPRVILTPAGTNGATLQYYNGTSGTSSFTIDTNTTPANSTIYKYNYIVIQ